MTVAALADRLDAVLPQTQCTRCGYPDCRAYAEAIAAHTAPIDRCPPGGESTLAELAALTGLPVVPLDPSCGSHGPLRVARIDESACIGCTLCIAACPVDAIVGAQKRMHGVLESLCSGCELCLPPCPVDCIEMLPAGRAWTDADANAARARHATRRARLARDRARGSARDTRPTPQHVPHDSASERRRASVAAAFARARARRAR